jgi:ParB family chromosome partitioning protein
MNAKKEQLIHVGARVRVANHAYTGAERWQNAILATVETVRPGLGMLVRADDEREPWFVAFADVDVAENPKSTRLELLLAHLRPSRWQYRRHFETDGLLELARSIQQYGLINPLLVFRHEDAISYELIAGERRLRASCALALAAKPGGTLAGAIQLTATPEWWADAPAMLADLDATAPCELRVGDANTYRPIVVLENLQRENPSPIEEAIGFQLLIEHDGYTQVQLAARLGKSQAYIAQRLGLLALAEPVRADVDAQAISFSAARAIASLPESVQPAISVRVQALAASGEPEQATTRKIQTMTANIRRFLNPDTWLPAENAILEPSTRNRLRLVRWRLQNRDESRLAEAVVALGNPQAGGAAGLLGKKPLTIAESSHLTKSVLDHLAGTITDYTGLEIQHWPGAAQLNRWTCHACQFATARRPIALARQALCARWNAEQNDDIPTCLNFIGMDDPIVLPLADLPLYRWQDDVGNVDIHKEDRLSYVVDFESYACLHERLAELELQRHTEEDRAKRERHLDDLRSYWRAQDPQTSRFDLAHGQAHLCINCLQFRVDLHRQGSGTPQTPDLPPCLFSVEPLHVRWQEDTTTAPGMGVLVRSDGIMVPRCERYRLAEVQPIAPHPGFQFPDGDGHAIVLSWLKNILEHRGSGGYDHVHTLPGALTWLPYPRPHVVSAGAGDDLNDLDRLLHFVRNSWQELGDSPGIAGLLTIGAAEATAHNKYHEPIGLVNPSTGQLEEWAGIDWERFQAGSQASSWPLDWPTPWIQKWIQEAK